MARDTVYSMLGLCLKAGKLVSGQEQTEKAVRDKTAQLVLVSSDASEGTNKRMHDKCASYNVPVFVYGLMEDMGRAVGRETRSCVAITDRGLADSIMRKPELEKYAKVYQEWRR